MTYIDSFVYEKEIAQATKLLQGDNELLLPQNVDEIIRFCASKNMGVILSRNEKATSCKDARTKRFRLGHIGIPLFDELKSVVFKGYGRDGNEKIIATHCRGHMDIVVDRIAEICVLKEAPKVMESEELKERFNMDYGTVSPILIEINSKNTIINIFDISLTYPLACSPGTMMTNAGEHTWGIEFDPILLIKNINNKIIDSIAVPKAENELKIYDLPQISSPKSIGIITGNGPDSGITLWEMINRNFVEILGKHFRGDISFPKVNIISLPEMGLSMELDKRHTASQEILLKAVDSLKDVDILSIACHTSHHFTMSIREAFEKNGGVFVSMAEIVIAHVKLMESQSITFLGVDYVADLQGYSAYKDLKNLHVEHMPLDVLREISELAYEVKKMQNLHRTFQKFVGLLNRHISSKDVVIALTELSILYQKFRKGKYNERNIIDSLELYAKIIARQSLGL